MNCDKWHKRQIGWEGERPMRCLSEGDTTLIEYYHDIHIIIDCIRNLEYMFFIQIIINLKL